MFIQTIVNNCSFFLWKVYFRDSSGQFRPFPPVNPAWLRHCLFVLWDRNLHCYAHWSVSKWHKDIDTSEQTVSIDVAHVDSKNRSPVIKPNRKKEIGGERERERLLASLLQRDLKWRRMAGRQFIDRQRYDKQAERRRVSSWYNNSVTTGPSFMLRFLTHFIHIIAPLNANVKLTAQ